MFDLIIIGMGISGITAGIYAKRAGLNVLMLEKGPIGGLLVNIPKIENYPGVKEIAGPDLAMNLFEQVNSLGIPYKQEEVISILDGDIKKVITKKGEYLAKNVALAVGRKQKTLGLENEQNFIGRGLSFCAMCDGMFYKDKNVAVIGGGDSALSEALYLSNICKKVYILNRSDTPRGSSQLLDRVKSQDNICLMNNRQVTQICGEESIESIVLDNGTSLEVAGIFEYVGFYLDESILKNLGLSIIDNSIETDEFCRTNIPGVFAIGDCRKKAIYQLVSAAYDGAVVMEKMEK